MPFRLSRMRKRTRRNSQRPERASDGSPFTARTAGGKAATTQIATVATTTDPANSGDRAKKLSGLNGKSGTWVAARISTARAAIHATRTPIVAARKPTDRRLEDQKRLDVIPGRPHCPQEAEFTAPDHDHQMEDVHDVGGGDGQQHDTDETDSEENHSRHQSGSPRPPIANRKTPVLHRCNDRRQRLGGNQLDDRGVKALARFRRIQEFVQPLDFAERDRDTQRNGTL